jgi:hypothetical protein
MQFPLLTTLIRIGRNETEPYSKAVRERGVALVRAAIEELRRRSVIIPRLVKNTWPPAAGRMGLCVLDVVTKVLMNW